MNNGISILSSRKELTATKINESPITSILASVGKSGLYSGVPSLAGWVKNSIVDFYLTFTTLLSDDSPSPSTSLTWLWSVSTLKVGTHNWST